MRKWIPLAMLASAQFIMVLDTSVMNVAISQIVEDLDTTIQGVQTAITLYTLVMAAFMLLGAKLGDILGRNRAFAIGLAIYGAGSLTTALSPNLAVLLIGWSGIEGFGAVLVIPAIAALTAASYEGRERALAYALLGGVAAIAIAAGPLIGGWVTTEFSWRYVFAAETVVVILLLLVRGQIPRAPAAERRPRLDLVGVALSSSGLGLIVFAILRSSVWGFVKPRTPPTINGTEITPLSFSPVPFLVLGGLALLGAFVDLGAASCPPRPRPATRHDAAAGRAAARWALEPAGAAARPDGHLLRHPRVSAGRAGPRRVRDRQAPAPAVARDARLRAAGAEDCGPPLAAHRRAGRAGRSQHRLDRDARDARREAERHRLQDRARDHRRGRRPARLAARERDHVLRPARQDSEGGGLQGTAQNLGSSLGTAIIGAVLLASLATGFTERVVNNPDIPAAARETIVANAQKGIDIVPVADVEKAAVEGGLTQEQAEAVATDYGDAQLEALRLALGAVAPRRCSRCGSRDDFRPSRSRTGRPGAWSQRLRQPRGGPLAASSSRWPRRFPGSQRSPTLGRAMFARLRSRLTYANVIASVALFMAMSGTGYALSLPKAERGRQAAQAGRRLARERRLKNASR